MEGKGRGGRMCVVLGGASERRIEGGRMRGKLDTVTTLDVQPGGGGF